ncbi:MAG TPA: transcriptional repressor [Lachnospiraceae bacterium]|jgi:Fe2+/Zn2+ uptake regulation proteins|nr:transcriptional repressor [Lachnospiraceae bacterium]
MIKITEVLRKKGLKVTPQRIAIYAMLSNTKSHPSAEEIYKALMPTNPTISLATVYKTLDIFKTTGLVHELSVGNGRSNYDANVLVHPHIVCTKCGKIYDFEIQGLNSLRNQVANQTDFIVESEQLTFYGTCPDCQKN